MVKEQNYGYSHSYSFSPFRLFLSTPSASLVPLSQGDSWLAQRPYFVSSFPLFCPPETGGRGA